MMSPFAPSWEFCITLFHGTTGRGRKLWALCGYRGPAAVCLFLCFYAPSLAAQPELSPNKTPVVAGEACGQTDGVVNINTASVESLLLLPGVGPKIAAEIVRVRQKRPFRRVRQIRRVRGIAKKKFRRLRSLMTVSGPNTMRLVRCTRKKRSS